MNFKIIITIVSIVLLVLIASVTLIAIESNHEATNTPPQQVASGFSFNSPKTLSVGETATFTDGLKLTLSALNDSRCKPGVVCVWAGEISAHVKVSGGGLGQQTQEFNLGLMATKTAGVGPYLVTINGVTETTATFTVQTEGTKAGCFVGGCSSQLCTDQPNAVSTCEYREEYACYKTATCARQQNGQCGWKQTVELTSCLQGK